MPLRRVSVRLIGHVRQALLPPIARMMGCPRSDRLKAEVGPEPDCPTNASSQFFSSYLVWLSLRCLQLAETAADVQQCSPSHRQETFLPR